MRAMIYIPRNEFNKFELKRFFIQEQIKNNLFYAKN